MANATRLHSSSVVSEKAEIGDGTQVWLFCQIRENVRIGKGCILGKGIYIESVDTSFFAGELNKGYLLRQLADALSVRKALEGMAVEECTRRATDEQLRALSRLLSKVEQRYARGEEQAEFDLKFHQTLVSLSGNALLTHMLKNLLRHSSGIWNIESPDLRDILRASIPAHRAMMDLMLGRDAAGAARVHHDYMNREISLIREMET